MTRIIITALFVFNIISSYGQKTFGIKIYQNTDLYEIQYYDSRTDTKERSGKVNFSRISIAFDLHTKHGYTHEIDLLVPEVSKPYDNIRYPKNYEFQKQREDFEGQASSYSLRYELSKTLTNKTSPFGFNLGIGINPYYVLVEHIPKTEFRYYSSTKLYGFELNMVPRIKYKLSQRFILDLNMPLKIYDLRAEKFHVKNPGIPLRQQTTLDYSNIFFQSAYTFRLGLMYKFGK